MRKWFINRYCLKSSILLFPMSTIISMLFAISSSRAPSKRIFNFSLSTCIPYGFLYSCSKISVTCNAFFSDILMCFGYIDLYSLVDSTSPVSLWSSLIDVGVSDLSRKQFLRNMILQICLFFTLN